MDKKDRSKENEKSAGKACIEKGKDRRYWKEKSCDKRIRYSCLEAEKEKSKKRQKIRKETSVRGVEMIQKVGAESLGD